jgi:hypothetical protein
LAVTLKNYSSIWTANGNAGTGADPPGIEIMHCGGTGIATDTVYNHDVCIVVGAAMPMTATFAIDASAFCALDTYKHTVPMYLIQSTNATAATAEFMNESAHG